MEVKILFDTVPFLRVEAAGGERVCGGAERDGDVGDDAAGMMRGQVRVQGVGQDAVARVGEEDEDEDEGDEGAHLGQRSGLAVFRVSIILQRGLGKVINTHDPSRHLE